MAKESMFQREFKRKRMCEALGSKRAFLRSERKRKDISLAKRMDIQAKLDVMPRDSSYIRKRNRCFVTGRPRGYYRRFGVSRIILRQFGGFGVIPGLLKTSW